jgi:hypothetical protein
MYKQPLADDSIEATRKLTEIAGEKKGKKRRTRKRKPIMMLRRKARRKERRSRKGRRPPRCHQWKLVEFRPNACCYLCCFFSSHVISTFFKYH